MPPSGPWVAGCCARTSRRPGSGWSGTGRRKRWRRFVDYYWILRWDLRGQPPHEQTILPHPNVNLGFEASGAGMFGVDRRLFTRSISGLGQALGVRFLAGGFRPFWQAPISQLTDRVVPAARLFGPQAEKTRQAIMRAAAGSGGSGSGVLAVLAVLSVPAVLVLAVLAVLLVLSVPAVLVLAVLLVLSVPVVPGGPRVLRGPVVLRMRPMPG